MLETNELLTQAQILEQLRANVREAQKAYIKASGRGPEVSAEYGDALEQRILQLSANVSTVQKAYIQACVNTGNLQVVDERRNTLLHLAAMLDPVDALEMAQILVETHKAKLDVLNKEDESPLSCGVRNINFVRYLLEQGANPNIGKCLDRAVFLCVSQTIQCLIEHGVSITPSDASVVQRVYNKTYAMPGVAQKHAEATKRWNAQHAAEETLLYAFRQAPQGKKNVDPKTVFQALKR